MHSEAGDQALRHVREDAVDLAFGNTADLKASRGWASYENTSSFPFVHSWCHNVRGPNYARADLRALKESGLRARFSYRAMQGHEVERPIDLARCDGSSFR